MDTNLLSVLEHGAEAVESRRNALAFVGRLGAGAIASMLPFGIGRDVKAQSAGDDIAILNYALTLEYLESRFYNRFVSVPAGAPTASVPAPPTGAVPAAIPAEDLPLFRMIRADENKHVTFLVAALGDDAIAPLADAAFDFTAGGQFNPTDYATFLILSQGFEDTGVRAYKGQAAFLTNKDLLTAALNIHSVEARHAAGVRRVRGLQGWIPGDGTDAPDPIRPVYQGGLTRNGAVDLSPSESNVTQGGVTIAATDRYSLEQIQEAFDEPLGTATVLTIADPFIVG